MGRRGRRKKNPLQTIRVLRNVKKIALMKKTKKTKKKCRSWTEDDSVRKGKVIFRRFKRRNDSNYVKKCLLT